MIAAALLLGLSVVGDARAQSVDDCLNDDSYPLAGTSGYNNGLDALRINAATYSATAFAERSVFPTAILAMKQDEKDAKRLSDGELSEAEQEAMATESRETGLGTAGALGATRRGPFKGWNPGGALVYETNQHYGVTRVPIWQVGLDCPEEYRVASRPMDLTSANIGAAGRYGRIGFFFSSAIVYGNLGEPGQANRITLGVMMPIVATYSLATTPLTGGAQVIQGSTAWGTDFIGGVSADLELVEVRAGYTASDGWYLSAGEERVGLFGNTVAKDGFTRVDQFAAGAKRVKLGKASEKGVGRPTAFARQVPMGEAEQVEEDGEERTVVDKLLTGHVRQDDIAHVLDVAFGYAFKPVASVHDVEVGVHSKNFHDPAARGTFWRIAGGMVEIPTQHFYGIDGGTFVSLRGELTAPFGINRQDAGRFNFAILFNDEEQLSFLPFAANAVTWRINVTGRL